jgi:type VI secretion system protein ImpL
MFFGAGQLTPMVGFSLTPSYMDASLARFRLELDGQRIFYQHDLKRPKKLQWPGPNGSNRTRLTFETKKDGDLVDTEDGAWAFYRILDTTKITLGSQRNQLMVTFSKKAKNKSYRVQYKLTTDSGLNPFRRDELAKFRVSTRL